MPYGIGRAGDTRYRVLVEYGTHDTRSGKPNTEQQIEKIPQQHATEIPRRASHPSLKRPCGRRWVIDRSLIGIWKRTVHHDHTEYIKYIA